MGKRAISIVCMLIAALFVGFIAGAFAGTSSVIRLPPDADVTGEILPAPPSDDTAKLDLNGVGKEDLMALPGIGEVLAQRILDFREENGAYTDIAQLKSIKGIGETLYEDLKQLVKIK